MSEPSSSPAPEQTSETAQPSNTRLIAVLSTATRISLFDGTGRPVDEFDVVQYITPQERKGQQEAPLISELQWDEDRKILAVRMENAPVVLFYDAENRKVTVADITAGGDESAMCLAWGKSVKSHLIAVGTASGSLVIVSNTGVKLCTFSNLHGRPIISAITDPSGRVYTVSGDGLLCVSELGDKERVWIRHSLKFDTRQLQAAMAVVAPSPDPSVPQEKIPILCVGINKSGVFSRVENVMNSLLLFPSAATPEDLAQFFVLSFPEEYGYIIGYKLFPTYVLACFSSGYIAALASNTGQILHIVRVTDRPVTSVAFCEAKPSLVAISISHKKADQNVIVLNLNDWKTVRMGFPLYLPKHSALIAIAKMRWNPDGNTLAVACTTGCAHVYHLPPDLNSNATYWDYNIHCFPVLYNNKYGTLAYYENTQSMMIPSSLPELSMNYIASTVSTPHAGENDVGASVAAMGFPPPDYKRVDYQLTLGFASEDDALKMQELITSLNPLDAIEFNPEDDAKAEAANTANSQPNDPSFPIFLQLSAFLSHESEYTNAHAARFLQLTKAPWKPTNLVALINPVAGAKKARAVLDNVMPVFDAAGVKLTQIETQNAGFAREFGEKFDLSSTDGVICVSGDTTLAEVLSGMSARPDKEKALRVPLGLIPAGNNNALAVSFREETPLSAALRIVRGKRTPLDAMKVTIGGQERVALVDLAFGMVGDWNTGGSSNWKFMGSLRKIGSGLAGMATMKPHEARFFYVPPTEAQARSREEINRRQNGDFDEDEIENRPEPSVSLAGDESEEALPHLPGSQVENDRQRIKPGQFEEGIRTKCRAGCEYCNKNAQGQQQGQGPLQEGAAPPAAAADGAAPAPAEEKKAGDEWLELVRYCDPPDATPEQIATRQEPWTAIVAGNTPKLNAVTAMTPFAHMSDGLIDVVLVRPTSKMKMVKLVGQLAAASGEYLNKPKICSYLQVRKLKLENLKPKGVKINIDGTMIEMKEGESVVLETLPSFFTFFGGW